MVKGAKEAAYGIEDTSLSRPLPEFAVSIGKLISFGFLGIMGKKEKPVRNGSQPDFFKVSTALRVQRAAISAADGLRSPRRICWQSAPSSSKTS